MQNPLSAPFRPVNVLSLGFYSLVVSILFGLTGVLFGLAGLIGSLVGMHVFFQFGSWSITGMTAGFAGIIIMPAVFVLGGLLVSLITYRPVKWVMQRL